MGCVYIATNRANGKSYVGMTTRDMAQRAKEHMYMAKRGIESYRFHDAISKYGEESFRWAVIFESDDESELRNIESQQIHERKSNIPKYGYNISPGIVPMSEKKERLRVGLLSSTEKLIDQCLLITNPDECIISVFKSALDFKNDLVSNNESSFCNVMTITEGNVVFSVE